VSPDESYWNERALRETRAALRSDDPRVAALHVDLATRCVRNAIAERERSDEPASVPGGVAQLPQR